ncbi:MAG: adenosylcobinamide-phosphate synthase CbiB [Treponema sp.]|nr:adenosylcobinamide-phosphate synthase CbiB [Treponema sp.]
MNFNLSTDFLLQNHIAFSLLAGFILDCLFGDPHFLPHPVRFMGSWIAFLEKKLNKRSDSPKKQKFKGLLLVFLVILPVFSITYGLLFGAKILHPLLFLFLESLMTYQCLAARSLFQESMKVYKFLKKDDIEEARKALSMIVGRDTDILDKKGIARAAVETVAENTSDGVVAPLFFTALFGPVGGMVYKAVNTMDSMIAYKNERYLHFGFFAAKLDDLANLFPSRISALLMILTSLLPGFNFRNAVKIFIRDRYKHASPNSAQTESVAAGALGVRLAGDTVYGGITEKKDFIGDPIREIQTKDIFKSNLLMYGCTLLMMIIGIAFWQ